MRVTHIGRIIPGILVLSGVSCCLFGVRAEDSKGRAAPGRPVFSHPTQVTNVYLPLSRIQRHVLQGTEKGKPAKVERSRKTGSLVFNIDHQKIEAIVVEDRDYLSGKLTETTLDYYAQADDGTVYYLGEHVDNYRAGRIIGHEGAWLAGVRGIQPGVMFPAHPRVGDKFRSENVPGVTTEDDEIVSVSETVKTPAGVFKGCVKTKETLSGGEVEYKYYAPKVGIVKEVTKDGEIALTSMR